MRQKKEEKEAAENRHVHVTHPFLPVYDSRSRILVLGTFPSVKSRENQFYYGHPRNRFWKVIAGLWEEREPETIAEKKALLLNHGIALWDVIVSCDIIGSSDSSIRNPVPAPLEQMLSQADIRQIFGNGRKACQLYDRYSRQKTGKDIVCLPSTSPANAACSLERLLEEWAVIKDR